jgi:hypothetical protein
MVHPLLRELKESYYRRKNPIGFRHDLGALDIFLDNFGILTAEQICPPNVPIEVTKQYLGELMRLLHYRWELLRHQVNQRKPWWGRHFNSTVRRANAGEPRGLLRFMGDNDWARIFRSSGDADPVDRTWSIRDDEDPNVLFDQHGFHYPFRQLMGTDEAVTRRFLYDDWEYEDLIPPDYRERHPQPEILSAPVYQREVELGGVLLPPDYPRTVKELRILHPKHATPDLELRVGLEKGNRELYEEIIRDQQDMSTCVAHAVCVGLDISARRIGKKRKISFSPAWLHCASGDRVNSGRRLSDAVVVIQNELPCEEKCFQYRTN